MNHLKNRPELNLIVLHQCSILEQLRLEEALLRADERNWCLIHQKPSEAIVMGISAQIEQVVDFNRWQQRPVPLIKRFSGGGSVFIDENCIMVTFIFNQKCIGIPCFPQPVLQWSEAFYRPVFENLGFSLCENDYIIGHKKFGGNAQYMTKNRWLHHTSFLWDYDEEKMNYLKMPPKMPHYRKQRSHQEFLCKLTPFFSSRDEISQRLIKNLENHFLVRKNHRSEAQEIERLPHRKATVELSPQKNLNLGLNHDTGILARGRRK